MRATWLFRRQSEADKAQQDAFLADIEAHWQPTSRRERLLHARSVAVHVGLRLFSGGPTLAPLAVALLPTAIGTLLLMVADRPTEQLDPGPPAWCYLLLTLGIAGFAFEAARSPRRVHPWRLALLAGLPCTIGSGVSVLTLRIAVPSDHVFRGGMVVMTVGAALLVAVPLVRASVRRRVLMLALRTCGVASAIALLGGLHWAWLLQQAAHWELFWGSLGTTIGTALLAAAFLHARPAVD